MYFEAHLIHLPFPLFSRRRGSYFVLIEGYSSYSIHSQYTWLAIGTSPAFNRRISRRVFQMIYVHTLRRRANYPFPMFFPGVVTSTFGLPLSGSFSLFSNRWGCIPQLLDAFLIRSVSCPSPPSHPPHSSWFTFSFCHSPLSIIGCTPLWVNNSFCFSVSPSGIRVGDF